jgi:hypothetical protein
MCGTRRSRIGTDTPEAWADAAHAVHLLAGTREQSIAPRPQPCDAVRQRSRQNLSHTLQSIGHHLMRSALPDAEPLADFE